ncbi:hybrid sensor histidine kinase/response regulator transcription factor [Plebeiibacterium marinum]|uniref:histidine kinase n=1 Tax=Plebeiibacterium marinum TaxID=2992111 RepID=A0AAE3MFL4_9BACT|nr:hybrid sensor histidine kinase/response regulator transcription factor [Plebeiobacterium marinum]MCW3806624.1 ATP-binding protein [Plebeiobacterium marinum]
MKKVQSTFILLFVLLLNVSAQKQYSFLQVNNADGLVNNQINCVLKDSRGFIWIGTVGGLSRYDGISFVNYKHNASDTTSVIDNYVIDIQEDFKGNLWVETMGGYNVYDIQKEKFYRNVDNYLGIDLQDGSIEKVYSDSNKQLWIKLYDHLYYEKYDSRDCSVKNVFLPARKPGFFVIDFVHVNNSFYYLYNNGEVESYDDSTFRLEFSDSFLSGKLGPDSLSAQFFIDAEKDIWFYGNNNGVYHFNNLTKNWKHYSIDSNPVKLTSNIIKKIIQDDKGLIWIGTDHGGIDVLNKYSGEITKIYHQSGNPKSIAQNSITDLYMDNNNIIWIGTYKTGLSYYHESIHKFPHYMHVLSDDKSIPFSDVNCFIEDKKGNLWIGTNGGGLIYFDRVRNTYTTYKHDKGDPFSLSSNVVVSVFITSRDELWVGTFAGGINRFDGTRFKRYQGGVSPGYGLTNNNIWSILEDDNRQVLVGTLGGGILVYNYQTDSFNPLPNKGTITPSNNSIYKICKLSNGNLFIGTSNGIIFYDVEEQRYKHHPSDNRVKSYPIGNKTVYDVFEDSRGLLWVATREGLYVFDPDDDFFKCFTEVDGLPQDIINCIEEDNSHKIWVSKSTGLSQIVVNELLPGNECSFSIYDYAEEDGLQGKEFNPNASYKTKKNELIFGGANGFNLFQPTDIKYNKVLPQVVFTDFQVYNQKVVPDSKIRNVKLLERSVTSTDQITIKHSMNVFSIDFTALEFFIPEKNRYQYKLQGFNEDWLMLENSQQKVTYTNLNAGDYSFMVKASNNDGIWNEEYAQLHIKVLPPFYATPWAYILYIVLILLSLVYYRYSMLKRQKIKFELEQERIQTKRNHEMDEMKLRFLTNISHEFRTPLTLILTPLHKLLELVTTQKEHQLLKIIDSNARQLLDLVNQLLDFRKLELHGLKYNPSYGNIVSFLQKVSDNFQDAFAKKNIEFVFKSGAEQLMLYFDKDKLQKVVMNLLSNAVKFTPENGKVMVEVDMDEVENNVYITVSDNGIGIKKEDQDKIFVRFYQSENNKKMGLSGSGIGLNLAREMVQLHNGTISFTSDEGRGTKFVVSLPVVIGENSEPIDEVEIQTEGESDSIAEVKSTTENPIILLVEDNLDFRTFMKETLQDRFVVHEAPDGKIGFDMVHKVMPDLIISDVMMPNVDGLELCQMLRNDIRTSHIPLILLTARTADEDKIKGLEIGADDYITKPFNMELLLLRVTKLIEKRVKMQKQFQKTVDIKPGDVQITSMDEKLIKKAVALVEKNISDGEFSVEDMSKKLGMSRVYLYKKLLSITGKSPIEFIRIIRLKRGAQLLDKSQMQIAEVAYEVGFNSPRLFSKYFKEEYGMLPTAYIKRNKQ